MNFDSVWCVVCGVWCVVCGVWCVVCGVVTNALRILIFLEMAGIDPGNITKIPEN